MAAAVAAEAIVVSGALIAEAVAATDEVIMLETIPGMVVVEQERVKMREADVAISVVAVDSSGVETAAAAKVAAAAEETAAAEADAAAAA